MSLNSTINDLIYNPQKLNLFFSTFYYDEPVFTRKQTKENTSSFRIWQLKYILLCEYINYCYLNKINIQPLTLVDKIYKTILNSKGTIFYKMIVLGEVIPEEIIQINSFNDIISSSQKPLVDDIINYCLCIYNTEGISHFFTIIYHEGKYYLNSSYGTDNICIPQYTTELNIDEFNYFIFSLNNLKDDTNNNFEIFFNKYFGKNGLSVEYSEEALESNPKKKHSVISTDEGLAKEISNFLSSEGIYHVGLIKNYQIYIYKYIDDYFKIKKTGGMPKKKTKKSKIKKSKTKKFKTKKLKIKNLKTKKLKIKNLRTKI